MQYVAVGRVVVHITYCIHYPGNSCAAGAPKTLAVDQHPMLSCLLCDVTQVVDETSEATER